MTRQYLENIISGAITEALADCRSDNPIEAWTHFIDILDARGRKRISEQLKEHGGRNPYTGELK